MSQSARVPTLASSNQPLQEKSDSGDSSGRSSPHTGSTAAEDEERIRQMAEHLLEDLNGIIAFSALTSVVVTISLSMLVPYMRPDSANPNTYAIWPIPGRLFSLAIALISVLFVGLSLRRPEGRPTQHDAWYQVTLCLYFVALIKLLLDVDFGLFITAPWWIAFISVTRHYMARWSAIVRTMHHFL